MKFSAELVGVSLDAERGVRTHFKQIVNLVTRNSVFVINVSLRTRNTHDLAAERFEFFTYAPGNVAIARKSESFAFYAFASVFQDFFEKIDSAVPRRFGSYITAAEREVFAR